MKRILLPALALFGMLSVHVAPAAAKSAQTAEPAKLAILSTTDVKGKTGPCGCHVPKGGLSRQASFVDSTRMQYEQVLLVDGGGFFPDLPDDSEHAAFLMGAMKTLGVEAVGVSERELQFGRGFLLANVTRTGLPLVSANIMDRATHKPLVQPWVIVKKGDARVGIFSVTSDKADPGPARDSLTVDEPVAAARRAVAELRKKGATVIVCLSQLGKVPSEDLATAVPGIDAIVAGRNVPLLQRGRTVGKTTIAYGGEQGQYMCRMILTLDAGHSVTEGESEAVMMSPEVGDNAAVLAMVKTFEDAIVAKRGEAKPGQ